MPKRKEWTNKEYYDMYVWEKCDYGTFTYRLRNHNITLEQAISPDRINWQKKEYYDNYKGKKCTYETYLSRIRCKHMTLENAIQPCSFE